MMRSRYPFLVIVLIVAMAGNALVSARAQAQPALETFHFAQHLYDAGQFRQAAEAFERFVFEAPEAPQAAQALYLAARAYQQINDISAAQNACERALALNPEEFTVRLYLLKSDLFKSSNAVEKARIALHNLLMLTHDPSIKNQVFYRLAWLDIEAGRFNRAQDWLQKISGATDTPASELRQQLQQADRIATKDPRLAGLLSILPGGGQLYTGRHQDAVVALILNGLFFWGAVEAFDQDQTALGLLLGGIGVNFYVGNIYSAINGAHKFNRNARNRFVRQLKTTFIRSGISYRDNSPDLSLTLNLPFSSR